MLESIWRGFSMERSLSASVELHWFEGLSGTPHANCLFVQVIPYITELLAKVHEQQAQAVRITGFQAQFGYVCHHCHQY